MIKFDETVKEILGCPNFACARIAQVLRKKGKQIAQKAEDEQAHVLYWMLTVYEEHGEKWIEEAEKYLKLEAEKELET